MTLEQIKEMETLKKRLKKCRIYTAVFIIIGLVIAIIAAIEYFVIQDMDCDIRFVIEMYNQENHELNQMKGI
jgi:hypothetical protein